MNTPAIFNPASISSAPRAAVRQSTPSPSDASFSKALDREIADRRNANKVDANNEQRDAQPAARPQTNQPAPAPQKVGPRVTNAKETEAPATPEGDAAQTDALSSTEDLLAFVSDIAGINNTAATDEGKDQDEPVLLDPTAGTVTELFVDPRPMMDLRPVGNQGMATATADTTVVAAEPTAALLPATDAKTGGIALKTDAQLATADEALSKDVEVKPATDFAGIASRAATDKRGAADTQSAGKSTTTQSLGTSDLQIARTAEPAIKPASIDAAALKLQDTLTPVTAAAMAPMQQSFTAIQAAAGHASEKLTPNVGTAAWDQALGQKVVWMVAGAQTSATMTLNPPDLGPMQIVLNVTNTDATATFVAAQPEVRQALEAAMPRLREMLADAGIQLGQANVNAGNPNQNNNGDTNQAQRSTGRPDAEGKQVDGPLNVTLVQPARGGLGMVDTFA